MKSSPGAVVLLAVNETIGSAWSLAQIWLTKGLVDSIVVAAAAGSSIRVPLIWLSCQAGLVLAQAAWSLGTFDLQQRLAVAAEISFRELLLEKSSRIPYDRLTEPSFLDRVAVLRRYSPLQSVNELLFTLRSVVIFCGSLGLIASAGGWVVVAIVAASLPGLWMGTANAREGLKTEAELERLRRRATYLEGLFFHDVALREIKALAAGSFLLPRLRSVQLEAAHVQRKGSFRALVRNEIAHVASQFAYYGAYGLMAYRVVCGEATVGGLTVFLAVFEGCRSAVTALLGAGSALFAQSLRIRDYLEFLNEPEEKGSGAVPPAGSETPPSIEVEGVTFRYPGAEGNALENVSFSVKPGETVAIVGRNGSGKSTLVKLMTGLHRPASGRILLDGRDLSEMGIGELRGHLAVAFQDFVRFQLTVFENVAIGMPAADGLDAEVEGALAQSGARTIVAALPHGLDTQLGTASGGLDLSAGQWQRIALARTLIRRGGLLVLDEPTASSDPEAESALLQHLAAGRRRTTILITQRPGPLRLADRILVLENGTIVESGEHASLARAGGVYSRLFFSGSEPGQGTS